MKKMLLAALLTASSLALGAQASPELGALDLGFAAPVVYGDPLNTNSQVGSIVYDMYTNTFRGLYANGNWAKINGYQAPTVQRLTAASGDYSPAAGVLYIEVEMVGGGGGGGSSGTTGGTSTGGNGGSTTFGTSMFTAGGGTRGGWATQGGAGGGPVVNLPTNGQLQISLSGGAGQGYQQNVASGAAAMSGAQGGNTVFGGAGYGGSVTTPGGAAAAYSGAGGGGGGTSTLPSYSTGSGGGAGAYIKAIIKSPDATYHYTVGTGGAADTVGNGNAGGAGGSGIIIVTEYYQ